MARQPNKCSTAKSTKPFRYINGPSGPPGVYGRKARSKRYILRHFLNITIEVAESTYSGRLFQGEGHKSEKPSCLWWFWPYWPTERFLCLISVKGMGVMWQAWSEDKQVVFHVESCRVSKQILKSTLNFMGNPVKGTQQWNTTSKLVVTLSQQGSVDSAKFGEVSVFNTRHKWIAIIETTRHQSTCK